MALLTVQDASNGLAPTFSAAAGGGDTIPTDAGARSGGWALGLCVLVRNAGAGAITATVDGLPGVSVPAAGDAVIPVPLQHFGAPRAVTYSGVTSVTVAAVRIAGK
jgi:hypothetical protein